MSAKLRLNKEVVLVAMGVKPDYYLQNLGWLRLGYTLQWQKHLHFPVFPWNQSCDLYRYVLNSIDMYISMYKYVKVCISTSTNLRHALSLFNHRVLTQSTISWCLHPAWILWPRNKDEQRPMSRQERIQAYLVGGLEHEFYFSLYWE